MVTGPIFRVEMVSAARYARYYLLRVVYAGLILFTLWAVYINTSAPAWSGTAGRGIAISELAQAAAMFFYSFSFLQLIGLLAVAPAMAVGTIATERERRTIEYLFATDLSNLEIVLGKTLARLLVVGKFALVSLPILFLFRLMGGIPAALLSASFLVAGSTALFVTALSVCVSVWSKRSRDASIRIYLVMAALLFLPFFLNYGIGWRFGGWRWWDDLVQPVLRFMLDLNPIVVLFHSMGGVTGLGAGFDFAPVLRMAAWHAAISVGLIALATTAVRRVHLRELGRGPAAKKGWFQRRLLPRWRPGLGEDPILWKESFAATAKTKLGLVGGLAVAAIGLTALCSLLYMFFWVLQMRASTPNWGNRNPFNEFLAVFTGFVGTGILLLVAARGSGLITIEKERDCWVSLISTPLDGGDIVRGKMLGNLYAARWGFVLLLFAWMLGAFFDARFVIILGIMLATLLLCAWFVTCVGLAFSIKSKTSLRSLGLTLGVSGFVGGLYLLCCCPVAAASSGPGDGFLVGMAPCMPFLLVFPIIAYETGMTGNEMEHLGPAFVIGVVGYVIACVVLVNYLTHQFDALAERTGSVPDGRRPN
jgi:ABC-type transport system involved in multi-copper enzyme maturation permease subunit